MIAEIITIGSELLLGQVVDTNFMYLSQQLTALGIEVRYRTTVGDEVDGIKEALTRALGRSELVVTSGGLGPGDDDLTRQAVAEVTGKDLIFREELMEQIRAFYHRLRTDPTESDRRQAYVPEGSIPIPNTMGTAPGFILKNEGKAIASLCGVPAEVQQMTRSALLPFITERVGLDVLVFSRILKLTGISETLVEQHLRALPDDMLGPSLGIIVYPGEIHLRLTAHAEHRDEGKRTLERMEATLRGIFGDFIFGRDDDTLESVVAGLLRARNFDVACVETYTAGRVAQRLVEADGSVLREGRIARRFKGHDLPRGSEKIALTLARMARIETDASLGLATISETVRGIPSTDFWVAMSTAEREVVTAILMARSPEINKQRAVLFALDQIRRFITGSSLTADAGTIG